MIYTSVFSRGSLEEYPQVLSKCHLQSVNFTPHSVVNRIFEDCEQHLQLVSP